jgi:hypothetical protein
MFPLAKNPYGDWRSKRRLRNHFCCVIVCLNVNMFTLFSKALYMIFSIFVVMCCIDILGTHIISAWFSLEN